MTTPPNRLSSALSDRYTFERKLGEGGMATVYLAHDVKHDRKVAIKVLRPELAAVLGAERFVQEIKTTANLQHPHILPLHDSGDVDGFLYYVMPYIEGETLRNKLDREKQLGIDEAVKIATDVADALDYAHRHDVIHRDIKPENILLHDGRPMVADFGIALAVSAAAGGRMTETGLSLGTPHYMSPEQATAEKDLSNRSDIYSLGAVLYEMLTGNPPHVGSTAQQIIMKIVTEDPAPVTKARRSVPLNVDAAVTKALEKLPADRFTTAQEFARALGDTAFTRPSVGAATVGAGVDKTDVRAWVTDRRTIALGVVMLVALSVALLRPAKAPTQVEPVSVSFTINLPPGERVAAGEPPAVSSDGGTVVFVVQDSAGQRLRLKRVNEFASYALEDTEGARRPFLSADGEHVAFWIAGNQVATVPIAGGRRRILGVLPVWSDRPLWAEDGRVYVGSAGSGIRALWEQGEATQLTFLDAERGERGHLAPRALPGGRILFTVLSDSGMTLATLAKDGVSHERLPITVDGPADYVEPGVLVFPASGRVHAIGFDPVAAKVRGVPTSIDDLEPARFVIQWRSAPATGGGTLAYVDAPEGADRHLAWVDRRGQKVPIAGIQGALRWPRLGPQGRRMVLGGLDADATVDQEDLWVVDLRTTARVRLHQLGSFHTEPVWTPDGGRITHSQGGGAFPSLWWQPADASGLPELLHEAPFDTWPTDWSPDGKELLFYGTGGVPPVDDIFVVDLEGNRRVVAGGPGDQRGGRFSPDGRWIAYQSSETGQYEVYVQPYPALNRKWPVSVGGGAEPVWSRDGRELFYLSGDRIMAVSVASDSVFAASPPIELFSGVDFRDDGGDQSYDVSPDGQRFLIIDPGPESRAELRVIVNWGGRLAALLRSDQAGGG